MTNPTETDLCNQALSLLGVDPIDDIADDEDDNAIRLNRHYEQTLAFCIGLFPWRFCMKKKRLSVSAEAPANEWTYAYDLPGDAIGEPWAVFNSTAVGARPFQDWEMFANQIFTDATLILIDYRFQPAITRWPPIFTEAFITGLAAKVCKATIEESGLARELRDKAFGPLQLGYPRGGLIGAAATASSMANIPEPLDTSSLIAARVGSGSDWGF